MSFIIVYFLCNSQLRGPNLQPIGGGDFNARILFFSKLISLSFVRQTFSHRVSNKQENKNILVKNTSYFPKCKKMELFEKYLRIKNQISIMVLASQFQINHTK